MTGSASTKRFSNYQRSVVLVVLAGLFLSTSGIAVRSLEQATSMQIVLYRSVGLAIFMLFVVWHSNRGQLQKTLLGTGSLGIVAGLLYAGASLTVIFALLNTTVANAMFIISLAPFFAAMGGWLFLRERVSTRTWVALFIAICGVLIMIEGGVSAKGLTGIMYAFIMAICYGGFSVCIRAGRDRDMLPTIALSGIVLAIFAGFAADSLLPSTHDIIICLAMGVFQTGLGGLCLTLGAQHIPAAQITLLAMLEVVLNPVWVWLGVGETPGIYSLVGGALIIGAIAYQAFSKS
ncbi:MAG: DMT family transporter [Pseudomonadales bacterium]